MRYLVHLCCLWSSFLLISCSELPEYDIIIRGGRVYDGSGRPPRVADVAVIGDSIAAVGEHLSGRVTLEIDATGLAVAPGFINMLSWANESLLQDGRSQSDIRQGVTLEVLGEGESMGPLNERMKQERMDRQGDIKYAVEWTTLGEYLEHLERRGISTNVASFVGATTVRIHVLGYEDRAPTSDELARMQELVKGAMEEGAMGVSSSLIYTPAFFAETSELTALCRAAARYGGMYISHLRSEGNTLLEALDELLAIARDADIPAEIYHLKAAGADNWWKLDTLITRVGLAREEGLRITADMYTYTAGATGLDAMMPPWVQEGGLDSWTARLRKPSVRRRLLEEISRSSDEWENFYLATRSPNNIIPVGFKTDSLKKYTGKTLAQIGRLRGTSPIETAMDLVVQDNSRVETIFFLMSENNVEKKVVLPWMSFGSDAESLTPEGVFLESNVHPRAYGNFARLISRYTMEAGLVDLEEIIRRLTSFPAENLSLERRGALLPGHFADIVVFDPYAVKDYATFQKPHRYSVGVKHVFVNGVQVLREGEHTGATPGRVVRGPGWKGGAPRSR
ncbi:MAG: D-aminoacylase [Bacteroidota bacterium]